MQKSLGRRATQRPFGHTQEARKSEGTTARQTNTTRSRTRASRLLGDVAHALPVRGCRGAGSRRLVILDGSLELVELVGESW
jgi:hypothetical protein